MDGKAIREQNDHDFGHLDPYQVMGLTIYGEARGENRAGKIAVATVIMERVEHRKWDGDNVVDVCLFPYQFSCFNVGDPNRKMLKRIGDDWEYSFGTNPDLRSCYYIGKGVAEGVIPRDMQIHNARCCQYLTKEAKDYAQWWKSMGLVKAVGAHEFYA